MTVEEILRIPQFNFLLLPSDMFFFIENMPMLQKAIDDSIVNREISDVSDTDEKRSREMTVEILRKYAKFVNKEKLMLYLGFLAERYLSLIESAQKGKVDNFDEYLYFDNKKIAYRDMAQMDMSAIKTALAEGVLIAKEYMKQNKKKSKKEVTEQKRYFSRENSDKRLGCKISTSDLINKSKSGLVLNNLDFNKIDEYLQRRLIKQHELINAFADGRLPKELAIDLMCQGKISREDVLKKIFKVNTERELVKRSDIPLISKLQLYSLGRINIHDLENAIKEKPDESMPTKDSYKKIARYYKGNIRKISELITHNVLDYSSSMEFLEYLEKNECITTKEKENAVKLMTDFKVDELLNTTTNGELKIVNHGTSAHRSGLTLDPIVRQEYFRSIGGVKQIFIRGAAFIDEEQDENKDNVPQERAKKKSKKNSLDGYQLIIIPEKGVAVLEKFYEVTRNSEGKLEYKRNEKGELIPAIENATYIMPIGMAKDFVQSKNKQELIHNKYVTRAFHTMDWVARMESGIEKVCRTVGTPVSFEKENTDLWSKKVKDNYEQLLELR